MADQNKSRKQNHLGNFFVDSTCIDCGTCYWMAPKVFKNDQGMSAVYQQPQDDLKAAYRALYSCPTNSIGVYQRDDISKEVIADFPYHLEGEVYLTGFHSESSFGATSYFIKGEQNYLIDSPRFLTKLTDQFKKLGGIDFQLLTHKDDIADTDKYHDIFKSPRYIHVDDQNNKTKHYEQKFIGEDEINLTSEIKVIPVPGHTKGSVCFLYKEKYLFTGDHLAFSKKLGHLYAFKNACWYDFDQQIKSMEKLLDYSFEYVLPGHSAPIKLPVSEMRKSLEKCIKWMKS